MASHFPRTSLFHQVFHHFAHKIDLILVHSMIHVWINSSGDVSTQGPQCFRRLVHTFPGNVEIHITAAEEYGRTIQRACVVYAAHPRADQRTAQPITPP